ncbi:hypothetical protein LTR10_007509 [Elasticomyces elasticus]|nr:hypothetical protein LTR10_007509 [Elasticomyces elasticus]KAK4979317.1 hypothetical protein LTR42_001820 [Elasticomyces elasticus]
MASTQHEHPWSPINPDNYVLIDLHCWEQEIDKSALGKRGWVFQERALSPRTIHFGKTQIAWECRQLTCNEVFQDGFLAGTVQRKAKGFLAISRTIAKAMRTKGYERLQQKRDQTRHDILRRKRKLSSPKPKAEISTRGVLRPYDLACLEAGLLEEIRLPHHTKAEIRRWKLDISPTNLKPPHYKHMSWVQQNWVDIVHGYTECGLSYASDKLVAIAGMAKMASRFTQCDYVAGLWRKDLEHQLLWKVASPAPAVALDGTRGPSWSWASVDGRVGWDRWTGGYSNGKLIELKWLSRVVSCKVESITSDQFGQVSSGSLVVTGPLKVLKLGRPETFSQDLTRETRDYETEIFWDTKELQERFNREISNSVWEYKIYHAAPACNVLSDVFFMPVRLMDHAYLGDDQAPMLQGLLLLPCADTRGTYQRVGQLTLFAQQEPTAFEEGRQPLQSGTEVMDHRYYQSALGHGEYTIVIV